MTEVSENLKQLRPGLWETVNQRYPGSMITKHDPVPAAKLRLGLSGARLCFVTSSGVQLRGSMPFDVVHPIGDFTYRAVPSAAAPSELAIHQLKYPTHGAMEDINVVFPIERLAELVRSGELGALTENFFSFIGYNMDPARVEGEFAENLADAVSAERPDAVLLAPA
ncbi:MAG TPA: glycine/sarcosine/betaine reductase selenoprotein B family protein [Candidatus Acidoferrales bacterium]|nr:glycine/sarcosine/betaine reductase selenoprotein B family protein [Candidatus Acidoferrales bacterium]